MRHRGHLDFYGRIAFITMILPATCCDEKDQGKIQKQSFHLFEFEYTQTYALKHGSDNHLVLGHIHRTVALNG